jgi:hypothetical protein
MWLRALLRDLFEAGLNEAAARGDVRAYGRSMMAASGNRSFGSSLAARAIGVLRELFAVMCKE